MNDSIRVGDRVVIRAVRHPSDKRFVGVQGEVDHCFESGGHFVVRTDGNVLIITNAVERVGEFSVGDRVVIRAVRHPNCERYVGRTGRIEHVFIAPDLKGNYKVVLDRGFAARIIASAVEAIPERDQRELSTSERALYATENHSWRDEASELDTARTQAMEFARHLLGEHARPENLIALADWALANPEEAAAKIESQRILSGAQVEKVADPEHGTYSARLQAAKDAVDVLGEYADLDDLLRLAEWALNEQTERVTFNPGGVIFTPNDAETTRLLAEGLAKSGRIVAEPHEPPRPPAGLQIIDRDGDGIGFHYNSDLPDVVALVDVYDEDGGSHNAFIRPADADRIIAFLQDAKAAKA